MLPVHHVVDTGELTEGVREVLRTATTFALLDVSESERDATEAEIERAFIDGVRDYWRETTELGASRN